MTVRVSGSIATPYTSRASSIVMKSSRKSRSTSPGSRSVGGPMPPPLPDSAR
jgi:hypothetical protein